MGGRAGPKNACGEGTSPQKGPTVGVTPIAYLRIVQSCSNVSRGPDSQSTHTTKAHRVQRCPEPNSTTKPAHCGQVAGKLDGCIGWDDSPVWGLVGGRTRNSLGLGMNCVMKC